MGLINRARTAIARLWPSVPARAAYKAGLVRGVVLDYGCGRGRDVEYFRDLPEVTRTVGYDPRHKSWQWPPSGKFDFVLCSGVLQEIEKLPERVRVLRSIAGHLKIGGAALIAVPRPEISQDELNSLAFQAGLRILFNHELAVKVPAGVTWIVVTR